MKQTNGEAYHAHVRNCPSCSGAFGHCSEGLSLLHTGEVKAADKWCEVCEAEDSVNENQPLSTASSESGKTEQGLLPCPFCGAVPQSDIPSHAGLHIVTHSADCWLGKRVKANGTWQELYADLESNAWNSRADIASKPDRKVLDAIEKTIRTLASSDYTAETANARGLLAETGVALVEILRRESLDSEDVEAVVITRLKELLETDELALRRFWNEHFPEKELEKFANAHGYSFD